MEDTTTMVANNNKDTTKATPNYGAKHKHKTNNRTGVLLALSDLSASSFSVKTGLGTDELI